MLSCHKFGRSTWCLHVADFLTLPLLSCFTWLSLLLWVVVDLFPHDFCQMSQVLEHVSYNAHEVAEMLKERTWGAIEPIPLEPVVASMQTSPGSVKGSLRSQIAIICRRRWYCPSRSGVSLSASPALSSSSSFSPMSVVVLVLSPALLRLGKALGVGLAGLVDEDEVVADVEERLHCTVAMQRCMRSVCAPD